MRYRFEKVDGLVREAEVRYRRLSVDLNPDFQKTGSFQIDIPNGTTIFFPGESPRLRHVWLNGRIVPDFDKEMASAIDQQLRNLKSMPRGASDKAERPAEGPRSQEVNRVVSGTAGPRAAGSSQQADQPAAVSRLTSPSMQRVFAVAIALTLCGFVLGGLLLVLSRRGLKR